MRQIQLLRINKFIRTVTLDDQTIDDGTEVIFFH